MDKNAERDRGRGCPGLGLYSQDTEEEQVWGRLASDMGSTASRSNQDFTVIAQRHGNSKHNVQCSARTESNRIWV